MLELLIWILRVNIIHSILMIRTCMIMFLTPKIPLKLMMIAACISVFLKFIIAFLSHLHIFHHTSNKCSSVSKFRVFVQLPFLLLIRFKLDLEYFIKS